MGHRIIDEHVKFRCYTWSALRWWRVNDMYHRDDDGPTFENSNNYRSWYKWDMFVSDNE